MAVTAGISNPSNWVPSNPPKPVILHCIANTGYVIGRAKRKAVTKVDALEGKIKLTVTNSSNSTITLVVRGGVDNTFGSNRTTIATLTLNPGGSNLSNQDISGYAVLEFKSTSGIGDLTITLETQSEWEFENCVQYEQAVGSATVWTVTHNLSWISLSPLVTLLDGSLNDITSMATLAKVDDNSFTATFTVAIAGTAFVLA